MTEKSEQLHQSFGSAIELQKRLQHFEGTSHIAQDEERIPPQVEIDLTDNGGNDMPMFTYDNR